MKRTILGTLLGTFAATLLALSTYDARASTGRSHSASECQAFDANGAFSTTWTTTGASQFYNPSTSATTTVICPVQSDTAISAHASTVALYVNGWKNPGQFVNSCDSSVGSPTMYIYACRAYSGGGGGSCGTAASPSPSTNFSVQPDVSGWTSGTDSDAYFVKANVGCVYNASDNVLWYYFISN
jgi:hypothetical protein